MNGYLIAVLAILLSGYLLDLAVSLLAIRSLRPEPPPELADLYDRDEYGRSQAYTRARTWLVLGRETLALTLLVVLIPAGGFGILDRTLAGLGLALIPTGLLYIGLLALAGALLHLPFSLVSTFIIDARFGLNRTTISTFILDRVKTAVLSVLLGAPLLALIMWFFHETGPWAWLWGWLLVVLFQVVMQFVAPVLILPLFNRFTPLPRGELRDLITEYARRQHFDLQGIYTMDGSRRSSRLNAFFTGFGRFRRIVLFDTLVEKLDPRELLAVLAHEMGHFRNHHILKMTLFAVAQTGLMFFLLSRFITDPGLAAAFGLEQPRIYAGLVFFGFLYTPVSTLLSIIGNFFSRRWESEADRFAVQTTGLARELVSALKKLAVVNLSNLTPHPFQIIVEYSHPPLAERIRLINSMSTAGAGFKQRNPKMDDEVCGLCGRSFAARELVWASRSGQWLCADCLAEEESCGCED